MCNNQLFLFALDALLPRSTIEEVFILRQVCKQGQEKIDKVMQHGVDRKESRHIVRSSMHLYNLYFSFYEYKFELDWVCYPWWSDAHFSCWHFPENEPCYIPHALAWSLNAAEKSSHEAVAGKFSFAVLMFKKAFPEFRPFYADQAFNVE